MCTGPEGVAEAYCLEPGSIRNVVSEIGGPSALDWAISEPEALVTK